MDQHDEVPAENLGFSQGSLGTFIANARNAGWKFPARMVQKNMKILVATEGSEFSKAAIEKCCTMVDGTADTDIRIVAASEPAVVPVEPFAVSAEYIRALDAEKRAQAEEVVSRAEQEVRSRLPEIGGKLSTTVTSGAPAQVIVNEAEKWGADLIVVGSHGYGFWHRALLGSVSNAVVHHAPCSVLVVRAVRPTKEVNN